MTKEQSNTTADLLLIKRLLSDESVKKLSISKETGIPSNTLSNYANGLIELEKMRLEYAITLTNYAQQFYKIKKRTK